MLCEKPMVFTASEAERLFGLAREQGVILMEAIKTAYCPGFQRLVSCAKSGKIGRIVSVDATFTKLLPSHARGMRNNGAGGSVTELASYPLRLSCWASSMRRSGSIPTLVRGMGWIYSPGFICGILGQ